jgi:hypothetical protein
MTKTVYISGPITKINREEAEANFLSAEDHLRAKGSFVINPISCIVEPEDLPIKEKWNDCMRQAIKLLVEADEIYMLDGWNMSQGCILERMIALQLDMPISYEGVNE